jgi:DNA-binding beta-propeller fold protein YncE
MAATGSFVAATGIAGASLPAYTLATVVSSGLVGPNGLAFDSAGDLFIANYGNKTVSVLPKASGTIFGRSVSADTLTTVVSPRLDAPIALAFDSAGDLFIASSGNTVSVLPKASGKILGHSVSADTLATVVSSGLDHPFALAFDSAGDLFIASYVSDTVSVLPKASGKIFGRSVTADTLATVVYPGLGVPAGLAFDSAGDLFIASYVNDTVSVLPKAAGKIFGRSVTADTLATVVSPRLDSPCSLAFD